VGLQPTLFSVISSFIGKLWTTAALMLTIDLHDSALLLAVSIAIIAAALVLWRRGQPLALWGLLWIAVASAPFSILVFGPALRYLHLPLVGFAIAFAELIAAVRGAAVRGYRAAAVVGALLLALWLGHVVQRIDAAQAEFVARGTVTRHFIRDLLHVLPSPAPSSTLVFHGMGELRGQRGIFAFGLEDAVRIFYNDATMQTKFERLGAVADTDYHLWYHDDHVQLLGNERK